MISLRELTCFSFLAGWTRATRSRRRCNTLSYSVNTADYAGVTVIWSILSAFLKAMPFASAYSVEGNLITIVTLNLIIAAAVLFSPFIVSQLAEGVNLSVGDTLRRGVLKTVMMANSKTAAISTATKTVSKTAGAYAKYKEGKEQ